MRHLAKTVVAGLVGAACTYVVWWLFGVPSFVRPSREAEAIIAVATTFAAGYWVGRTDA